MRVLVDQAVEDGFSVDPFAVEAGHGGAGRVAFVVGDALRDTLVRPGAVIVRLVFGQHGAQVCLAEDQHAVQDLSAQGAGEAFAGRVHARSPDGAAEDSGAGGLEYGVERAGEVRSAAADQELDVLGPLAEAHGEVPGLLHGPLAGGVRGDAAEVHPAGAVPGEHQDVQSFQ